MTDDREELLPHDNTPASITPVSLVSRYTSRTCVAHTDSRTGTPTSDIRMGWKTTLHYTTVTVLLVLP